MVPFCFLNLLASLCTSRAAKKAVLSSCSIHVPYPHLHRAQQHMDPWFFPHVSKCDDVWGHKHALCPLALRHLKPRLFSPSVILADSNPCRQRSPPAQLLSPSRSDLRSLGDSHTFGIVYSLVDLMLSHRSNLLSSPLLYLVVLGKNVLRVRVGHTV